MYKVYKKVVEKVYSYFQCRNKNFYLFIICNIFKFLDKIENEVMYIIYISTYITYILGLESSKSPPPPHFPKIKYERTPKYLVTY